MSTRSLSTLPHADSGDRSSTDETTFTIWRIDGVDLVRVCGVLDLPATVRLRLTLFGRLDAGAVHVVVDLSRVRLLDAGSMAVLLRVADRLAERDGTLMAPGARGVVLRALEIGGVAQRLRVYEPIDARLADPVTDATELPVSDPRAVHGLWGDEINALIGQLHRLCADDPARARVREQAIRHSLPFAYRLARRFHGLGEPPDDLHQVAAVGLLKAVDRYDPAFGTDFASYAVPTIVGELRRHFRDRGWTVRVPRRLQELRLDIRRARIDLNQQLNRLPTVAEIADRLDVDQSEITEAIAASGAYQPASLDAPIRADQTETLLDGLGQPDAGYTAVDDHESLQPLIAALPTRERNLVILRFFGNLTQNEISTRLGISQMHVSRLLTRTLAGLQQQLLATD
jgi:RNA polymerase sigma-B factor